MYVALANIQEALNKVNEATMGGIRVQGERINMLHFAAC